MFEYIYILLRFLLYPWDLNSQFSSIIFMCIFYAFFTHFLHIYMFILSISVKSSIITSIIHANTYINTSYRLINKIEIGNKLECWMGFLILMAATFIQNYSAYSVRHQGAVSIRKTVLPGMAIPMLKISRPNGRLIFNMEIAIRR